MSELAAEVRLPEKFDSTLLADYVNQMVDKLLEALPEGEWLADVPDVTPTTYPKGRGPECFDEDAPQGWVAWYTTNPATGKLPALLAIPQATPEELDSFHDGRRVNRQFYAWLKTWTKQVFFPLTAR